MTVRERLVGLVVHFDDEPVRAHGDGGARQRQDFFSPPRAVAGIDDDRQVAEPVHGRDNTQIECVARMVCKSPDPALAQDNSVVPLSHDVFRGHEKLARPAALSSEKFCMFRAPIWMTSA